MKKFLPYLKKYGVLGAAALITVAGIPASWYFSSAALADVQKSQQKKVEDASKELTGARISYKLEPTTPGQPGKEESGPPNQKLIADAKLIREQMAALSRNVFGDAVRFNRGPRSGPDDASAARATLLVPELLPDPGSRSQVLRLEMARKYATTAHQALLAKYRAGPVFESDKLGQELEALQFEVLQRTLQPGQDPASVTPDQRKQIEEALLSARLRRYREQAGTLSFYCDVAAFVGVRPELAEKEPTLDECFDWQMRFWITEDILRAAALANQGFSGVPASPVKRIELVNIGALAAATASSGPNQPSEAAADPAAVPAANLKVSPSGRSAGPGSGNGMYDIRLVDVTAVVAIKSLPQFLDAFPHVNFMTVLDCDLSSVDLVEELRSGYAFGNEPCARVQLRLETVWLREWTKKYMPADVRTKLGIAPDAPPVDPNAPAPTAPSPKG